MSGYSLKLAVMANRPSRMLSVSSYDGLSIPICGSYVPASSSVPWPPPSNPKPSLHDEVLSFLTYMEPRTRERAQRVEILSRLSKAISTFEPGATIEPVGSYVTRLYLPTSDIDVFIKPSASYAVAIHYRSSVQLRLSVIQRALLMSPSFNCTTTPVLNASVPLLRVTETITGISFDLTFEKDHSRAATVVVQDWGAKLDETRGKGVFRALVLVLKQFLAMRRLGTTYTGGINSYVLVWMVAAYLKLEVARSSHNLGVALMGFLKFFGTDFQYETTAIKQHRVLGPRYESKYNYSQPYLLSITDPADATEDMGKKAYAIKHVKESFAEAYRTLAAAERSGTVRKGGILGTILGGNWDEFRRARRKSAGSKAAE